MKHISQPVGSNLCGQTCVAMIAGISLGESVKVFGKRGCTTTKDVAAALRKLGIPCGDKLIRLKKGEDPVSAGTAVKMVVLHYDGAPKHHAHWVVLHGDLYYDPAESIECGYDERVRITSYLPVYLTEKGKQ
jgi:hypothetical protein